jgi:hypothetical protein
MVSFDHTGARLRGLFDFKSVIFGDGLFLPIAAALITVLNRKIDEFLRSISSGHDAGRVAQGRLRSAIVTLAAPLVAMVLTVGLHLAWLRNPTFVNWTVPVPGHLNAPGWYHGLFMWILMWWLFGGFIRMSVGLFPVLVTMQSGFVRTNVAVAIVARIWVITNLIMLCLVIFNIGLIADYAADTNSSLTLAGGEWNVGLVSCLLATAAIQVYFARHVWWPVIRSEPPGYRKPVVPLRGSTCELRRQLEQLLMAPMLLVAISSLPVLLWALHILRLGWPMAFSGLILPLLFAENLWSELYHQQDRPPRLIGICCVAATFVGSSAALLLGLALTLESQDMLNRLSAVFAPWWNGCAVSFLGVALITGLAVCLCSLEEGLPTDVAGFWTPMRPRNDLIMDYAQFWALHQVVIVAAALYVSRLSELFIKHLKDGDVISLLYGFTGLVVVGVMLPLRTNVNYIEQQERSINPLKHRDIQHSIVMSFLTALVAGGVIIWLWLRALTSILG